MNKKIYLLIILLCFSAPVVFSQQSDSIFLKVKLDTLSRHLLVEQDFYLTNRSNRVLKDIYFHAWANAYSGRATVLNQTKLQDRKGNLHFSEKEDRGGIKELSILTENQRALSYQFEEREFIRIGLENPWKIGELLHLRANYSVKLPFDAVTRYGRQENGDYLLKYFFLQPAVLKNEKWLLQHYKDFEELAAYPSTYILKMEYPDDFYMFSDLELKDEVWKGNQIEHFRIYLTRDLSKSFLYKDSESNLDVEFGFGYSESEKAILDSILPKQIHFLREHLGILPTDKLFISSKTKKEQNYFGVDDLDAWLMQIKLFTEEEKNALKLFQILSYEYIDRLFSVYKIEDHWLKNGLQTYLQMKYVDEEFPKLKLLGHLPEDFKLLGIRPLKFFHASKLEMNDRYKLLYLYLARQNYDQPINTPFDQMSNLNQFAISAFKTGLTFYYMDQYLGGGDFYRLVQEFAEDSRGKLVSQIDFQNYILQYATKDLSWFFDDYIDKKDKINFKLLNAKETEDSLLIKIRNDTKFSGPFQIVASQNGIIQEEQWYVPEGRTMRVKFPKGEYDKIELNPGYLFPEFNDKDNYMKTSGLFKNSKKIQLKLYSDIENPEYSQIFMNPQLKWNNYDKLMVGIKFHNQSLLTRPFKWNLSPKFSTGTRNITGSGSLENTFTPRKGLFRSITLGAGMKYEHYAKDLSYLKWYAVLNTNFAKDPRGTLSHGFHFTYDDLDKQVPQGNLRTDEDRYNLWNFSYYYSKPDYIQDFSGSLTFQTTANFQKIYGEWYYRFRYLPRKRIGVRLFAGIFTNNQTNTDYFNFGLSKVSDYAFNFNLLGRSENTGILSQQFVMAEGGFKSNFDFTVNNWLVVTNIEVPIWKMFDFYADAGIYRNKGVQTKFIYDTGIRFRIIPDFLEFYLPVQSSLGFEPVMKNYWEHIRFTLTLNLSSMINYLRRGWY